MSDYYELLGVSAHASEDEIKKAYRNLARQYHPDARPGDPASEARFKEITMAYETLRDPERRRRYDMFGPEGATRAGGAGFDGAFGGGGFGINDLFDAFFSSDAFGSQTSGPQRGGDAEILLDLELSEAAFGVTRSIELQLPVPCEACNASGCEPGTHPSRCETCDGSGQVRQTRRSILGPMVTAAPCAACSATGQVIPSPCRACHGQGRVQGTKTIEVEIPAGIDDGQRLRLGERGPAAPRGGASGDLYVNVRVLPHPSFERHGPDLLHVRRIPMTQAVLGAQLTIDTLDGPEEFDIMPGTQPGHMVRLKGRGVPMLRGRGRGDLLIRVEVEVPERLADEEVELLRQFAAARGEKVAPEREAGFFSRVRSAFQ